MDVGLLLVADTILGWDLGRTGDGRLVSTGTMLFAFFSRPGGVSGTTSLTFFGGVMIRLARSLSKTAEEYVMQPDDRSTFVNERHDSEIYNILCVLTPVGWRQ